MKDFIIIKEPEIAKLFADPVRREILHNLRHREMTCCQLAKALDKNLSSIAYHLNALEQAGLVKQSRTVVKGNLIEKFYQTTAKDFIISYTLSEGLVPGSEDIAKWSREVCRGAVKSLEAFGYVVSKEKEEIILNLIEKYASLEHMVFEGIISEQKKPIQAEGPSIRLLLNVLMSIRLHERADFQKLLAEISQELRPNSV
ncbi:MAG: winged helix-turn-helix domain-containing protein [Candidatus Bathyarchaeia archaeon]|nr:helix-turn-helix transcriptional regulator [Candidatus Bathyarchaeota archaeon]